MTLPPHLVRKLQDSTSTRPYAVIDFDNTCIFNDIGEAVLAHLCEHKLLYDTSLLPEAGPQDYHQAVFHRYHQLLDKNKIQEAYEFAVRALAGYDPRQLQDIVDRVIKFEGQKLGTRTLFGREITRGLQPKPQTKELLTYLQHKGIETWIISASAKVLVEYALNFFFPDLHAKCIGIEAEQERGRLTKRIVFPTPTFDGKVDCIKKYIDPAIRPVLAIGDSLNDLAMLEYAEIPLVVDRKNSLAEIARERGWTLLH